MRLSLNEIIWEYTLKCDNNCAYCGSKDILNTKSDIVNRKFVIDRMLHSIENMTDISELTLSGGEPVLEDDFESTVLSIKEVRPDITLKVLTNNHLDLLMNKKNEVIDAIDVIGISINTKEDIDNYNSIINNCVLHNGIKKLEEDKKLSFITNFNTDNIWLFDDILELLGHDLYYHRNYKMLWQVQLTVGYKDLPPAGITYLRNRCMNTKGNVLSIMADNLVKEFDCPAGFSSCGILYNGDVIPCLSQRASNISEDIQGNITSHNLKDIWENEFKEYRFSECSKCCRDEIEYPDDEKLDINKIIKDEIHTPFIHEHPSYIPNKDDVMPHVFVYACPDYNKFNTLIDIKRSE